MSFDSWRTLPHAISTTVSAVVRDGSRTVSVCSVWCSARVLRSTWVDGTTGVKDFDVWTFFAEIPGAPFPPRWRTTADFGLSRFGLRDSEPDGRYVGRRVDFVGRSLHVRRAADPRAALQAYLTAGKTESARRLAEKAAVTLAPSTMLGEVIWPPLVHDR